MQSSTNLIHYEKKDGVAHITLNRPEVLNAINHEMSRQHAEALIDFRDDPAMFVAIITGAGGRAFSSGADLTEVSGRQAKGLSPFAGVGPRAAKGEAPWVGLSQLDIWKPVIAAIDGYCVAGGMELALECDIRVASEQSTFGLPEPRWSLLAGYGLHNLSRMIPLGEALYMQLTGSLISAQEASRIGLVHGVYPDGEATMAAAWQIAEEVKLCGPLAVRAIKRIVMTARNLPVEYSTKFTEDILGIIREAEDSLEGPRAFAEKRKPQWKGR